MSVPVLFLHFATPEDAPDACFMWGAQQCIGSLICGLTFLLWQPRKKDLPGQNLHRSEQSEPQDGRLAECLCRGEALEVHVGVLGYHLHPKALVCARDGGRLESPWTCSQTDHPTRKLGTRCHRVFRGRVHPDGGLHAAPRLLFV